MRFSEVHSCKESAGRIVSIELDPEGNVERCAYCQAPVLYSAWFTKHFEPNWKSLLAEPLYEAAIKTWGEEAQLGMVHEEIGEFLKAVNKHRRRPSPVTMRDLEGEIADLRIMLDQTVVLFKLSNTRIKVARDKKLERLGDRLEEGQTCQQTKTSS